MTQNKKLEKFAKLVSDKPSNFLAKLEQYNSNKKWLDYSSKVAINVLEILKEKNWSQKDLAEKMNVSAQQINKIVKGQQNLTFETVAKLEEALEFKLVEIPSFKPVNEIITNSATQVKSFNNSTQEKINLAQTFSDEFIKKDGGGMTVVYNKSKPINYKKTG